MLDEAKRRSDQDQARWPSASASSVLPGVLIVDGEFDKNFQQVGAQPQPCRAAAGAGLNVYDIMRRDTLVLTKRGASKAIEERLA